MYVLEGDIIISWDKKNDLQNSKFRTFSPYFVESPSAIMRDDITLRAKLKVNNLAPKLCSETSPKLCP